MTEQRDPRAVPVPLPAPRQPTRMDSDRRRDIYRQQTGRRTPTPRQYRRWRKKLRHDGSHRHTAHGHGCCGLAPTQRPAGMLIARCGGPGLCTKCGAEAARIHNTQPHT